MRSATSGRSRTRWSRANDAISSAPFRDFANAIVRTPWPTRAANSSAASAFALRRAPDASSITGGFHSAKCFCPRGDAPQAAKNVGDVRTEDPAQRVHLVDRDDREVLEEHGPAIVGR